MLYKRNESQMEIYHEGKKRRILVATLAFNDKTKRYELTYNLNYLKTKSAIPIGRELPINKIKHVSEQNKIFPTFLDRIPDRENPAYPEYCQSQGISPDEDNLIVLLTTIGRRGPSTFVFEPVYELIEDPKEELIRFREQLDLSRWEVAKIFDIPELTLLKIENGTSKDINILRLLSIYLNHPEITLEQMEVTGTKVHVNTRAKLHNYFVSKLSG